VVSGDDDLARQSIARAHEHEVMAQALISQRTSAEQKAQTLRGQVAAMKAKQTEARRKLESLAARRQVVENSRALRGIMDCKVSSGSNGFARFEKLHRQIEQAEAEAEAMGELYESAELSLQSETESREQSRRVEAELAAIKERIRASQPPAG
jgi:phage shock protein A